ncbi:hypothetical protein [Flagellimonas sp. S3867]|uniref:hypothetical protein n=1 Tax=Flagellimonas sp. S3867 TaxID=2768063 RepID=UPI0016824059|nr:hypothetical protein [Flagellimonas sp. S3867]
MNSNFNTSLEILQSAREELLYNKLLQQIKKDFTLANVELKLFDGMEPTQLKDVLHEKIYFLLLEKFQQYLNLLYIIDIPEKELKKIRSLDAVDASSEVCFLILKREWQKVWFKNKYNT